MSTSADALFANLLRHIEGSGPTAQLGLVKRLRNGGQADLADMASIQERTLRLILAAMDFETACPGTFDFERCCNLIRKTLEKTT